MPVITNNLFVFRCSRFPAIFHSFPLRCFSIGTTPWFNILHSSSVRGPWSVASSHYSEVASLDSYIFACPLVGTWARRRRGWLLIPKEKSVAARAFGAFFARSLHLQELGVVRHSFDFFSAFPAFRFERRWRRCFVLLSPWCSKHEHTSSRTQQ